MRIHLRHETTHHFNPPARGLIQVLRATPRSHDGQHVAEWRIDIDTDCRLKESDDAYGNIVHTFSLEGPAASVTVTLEGEVETFDTAGVLHGAIERFPLEFFLRDTALTRADEAMRTFARNVVADASSPLDAAHRLMGALHRDIAHASGDPDSSPHGAIACFKARAGDTRDIAHIYVALARSLGAPARTACGYHIVSRDAGLVQQRLWAETHVEGVGWIAFDPAANLCPSETYVRVACGLDWLDVAPVRSSHSGGGPAETMERMRLAQAPGQSQSQG